MTRHLDTATIYALLDGELDGAVESAAEAHLLRCSACRAVREECATVRDSLAWYGATVAEAPAGYWDDFWSRFEARVTGAAEPGAASVGATPLRPLRRAWMRPALAAAAIAFVIGGWWATGRRAIEIEPLPIRRVAVGAVVADTGWESDVEFFERATVAVGSVDPVSKGLVLASLAEAP